MEPTYKHTMMKLMKGSISDYTDKKIIGLSITDSVKLLHVNVGQFHICPKRIIVCLWRGRINEHSVLWMQKHLDQYRGIIMPPHLHSTHSFSIFLYQNLILYFRFGFSTWSSTFSLIFMRNFNYPSEAKWKNWGFLQCFTRFCLAKNETFSGSVINIDKPMSSNKDRTDFRERKREREREREKERVKREGERERERESNRKVYQPQSEGENTANPRNPASF